MECFKKAVINFRQKAWYTFYMNIEQFLGNVPPYVFVLIGFWELAWKGFALWKAARNEAKVWFVALLVFNTLGILPIAYLLLDKYYFHKKD